MTNLNFKKVILIMVIIVLFAGVTVLATDGGIDIITNTNVDNPLNVADTNTTNTNTNTNTNNNTTNLIGNTSTYNNTTNLPQTGAGDYTMILIIAAFILSAAYAYKKIRDYKNI